MKKGVIYLSIASAIFMISGYIVNIWLGRHLGPEAYGIYGIVISLVTIINLTQTTGLPLAVSKFVSAEPDRKEAIYKTGFYFQLISTGIASLFFYICSGIIASLLKDTELTPYLKVASLIFPFYGIYALMGGYYNGIHHFRKQAIMNIVYSIAKTITIIGFTILYHLYGVIFGFILSPLIALFFGLKLPGSTHTHFSYKKLLFFSLPLIGLAIFSNLLQSIDLFLVKTLMHSDSAPGFYTASQSIARIPLFGMSALSLVLFPSISSHLSQKREDEARSLIVKSLRIVILLLTPTVLMISGTTTSLLSLLYTSAYTPAAEALSILVIAMGFLTIFTVQSNILNGASMTKVSLYTSIIGVVMTVICCFMLIPFWGITGAAVATCIGCSITVAIASIKIYQRFHSFVSLISIVKIAASSFLIFIIGNHIFVSPNFLPILYLFQGLIYLGTLFFLKEITQEDIRLAKSFIPEFILRRLHDKTL